MAIVPSVLLASAIGAWRDTRSDYAAKRTELAGVAAALAAAVSEPLATGDHRQVANALKGIGAIRGLTHARVASPDGTTVFQFGHGILVSGRGNESLFSLRTTPIDLAITHAGRTIGRLTLIADISELSRVLRRNLEAALLVALSSVGIGLLLARRLQTSIVLPLRELTEAMREVRDSKSFERVVPRTSADETGTLVDSFNGMLREIHQRDTALTEHRAGLEATIELRTHDLAAAAREADRANAAKSDFLATMSHEIRTPMNGMLVMAELLAADDLGPRARRHCEVILRSGQTLLSIINDILDLSKIESGHLTLEKVPVDLATIVDDVVALFAERAGSKKLELAAYMAPGVPAVVEGDPIRLTQILSNLVNNALKFTETGGVLIRLEPAAAGGIALSVNDTGIGIAADKLATIFEPFTQAEQSTSRRFGGTGIGLTICRRLAGAMGGDLTVESKAGSGATFTLRFTPPAVDMAREAIANDPLVEPEGTALLWMAEGPARTALAGIARDMGLTVVEQPPGAAFTVPIAGLKVMVATADTLVEHVGLAAQVDGHVIALSPLGDSTGGGLVGLGLVQAALETPFGMREARAALLAPWNSRPAAGGRSDMAPAAASVSFRGARVLAADDSPVNREVLMEALRRLDVEVVSVADGAAAVEALEHGAFDLVFMDGSMPVLDGFAATRIIRAREADQGRPPLPIIGLSAHVVGSRSAQWRDAGMSDFIAKPFTLASIRACLQRWLGGGGYVAVADACGVDRSAAGTDLVDPSVLDSIREMQSAEDDLVGRVVALYAEHAPELLRRLVVTVGTGGEPTATAAAAHALKSLCRNVGAVRVGEMCEVLEGRARSGATVASLPEAEMSAALAGTIDALRSRAAA